MNKNLRFRLKLDRILKYWNYLQVLRVRGILIFCQNLSLDASKDLALSVSFTDQGYGWKFLNKKIVKKLMERKLLLKVKNFNTVLLLTDLKGFVASEKILKKNDILILGYYLQKVFFFKQDFDINKTEKCYIFDNLKQRIANFYLLKKKIILNIKKPLIKIILLLKKR